MGRGTYSSTARSFRAESSGYYTKSAREIFSERNINNAMNPNGIDIRESRDSNEHPESLAIILGLDVTGSMGSIPHYLIKDGLPHIMDGIIKSGVLHPQLLFLAIGDHVFDNSPLQVGQFESSDELLDHWLTTVYLEGGGGPNAGESYLLAWYFAAMHTSIDCFEKRNQKGVLFTIGDEPTLTSIKNSSLNKIMGNSQGDYRAVDLLTKAQEKYHVYHLHLLQGSNGRRKYIQDGWKQLMGDNLLIIEKKEDVGTVIVDTIKKHATSDFITQSDFNINDQEEQISEPSKDDLEIIL